MPDSLPNAIPSAKTRKLLPLATGVRPASVAAATTAESAPARARVFVPPRTRAQQLSKRLLDLGIAIPLTVALGPLMLAIAAAVKLESPGPALFRQERRGKELRRIVVRKFRTMRTGVPDPHERYETARDDPRITRLGALLRVTSLDELPQLLNVIEGSMSLVGPRPLVEWESQDAYRTHPERYAVLPGVTGLAQLMLRNAGDLEARLDRDSEYVRFWNLGLDLALLAQTPIMVLTARNIYPRG